MGSPKVTIGLPVYNGARYLGSALDALLAQDVGDFELVVSDNASTDETPAILAKAAARDPRVRVVRQEQNLGSSRNFAIVLAEARTPYFMWAAHDDRFAPSYARKLLAALEATPGAVLAVSGVRYVDGEGKPIEALAGEENLHTIGLSRVERLRRLFVRLRGIALYGLARADDFRRVDFHKPMIGHDIVAVLQLLLLGDVVRVDEPLFEYRIAEKKSSADYVRQLGGDPSHAQPYTSLFIEAIRSLFASDWTPQEKEEALVAAVATLARENGGWRRQIGKEHFGRLHRISHRLFAADLCWRAGRALPGGTNLSLQFERARRVQREFGRRG